MDRPSEVKRSFVKREEIRLESSRFTNLGAFVREVLALLESSSYRLILVIRPADRERLDNELESVKSLGRVKVLEESNAALES